MRRLQTDTAEGHTFLVLGSSPTILDLGCNQGKFSSHVASRYGARVVALEPDPAVTPIVPEGVEVRPTAVYDGKAHTLSKQVGSDATVFFAGTEVAIVRQ